MTEKKLTINELRAGTKSSRAFRIGVVAVIAAVAAAGVWYFGFADKVKARLIARWKLPADLWK